MRFRPCIDLRNGNVVQIVGSTLSDEQTEDTVTNFTADRSAAEYAELYKQDYLTGGHVISLGPGNENAALEALKAFPGGLQIGGGITPYNAQKYLDAGASHVIVTSYVFSEGQVNMKKLEKLVETVGKERLVIDLSCRKRGDDYWVVTEKWQTYTNVRIATRTLKRLAEYCDEFLIHGVDVEGRQAGIESYLVEILGRYSPIPVTYAGGAKSFDDLERVNALGNGKVDLTIGSALDIFGGTVPYDDVVAWHTRLNPPPPPPEEPEEPEADEETAE